MENGMMGTHRKVEILDDYVIKKARTKTSRYCNEMEATLSGTNPYLAKVIEVSSDYSYLKMERVKIPKFTKRLLYARYLKIELKGISDIHWFNIGEKNGKPVLFDYGQNFVLSRLIIRKIKYYIKF